MNILKSSHGIVVVVALSLMAGRPPQAFAGSQKKKEGLKPVGTILGAASQAKVVFLAGSAVTEENLNGDIPLSKKDLEKIRDIQKGDFGRQNFEEILQDIVGILGLEGTEVEEARSRYRPGGSGMVRQEHRESSEELEKTHISKKRRQKISAKMADITVCGYRTFGLVAARIPVIGKYGDQRTPGPVAGSQSCYRNGKKL